MVCSYLVYGVFFGSSLPSRLFVPPTRDDVIADANRIAYIALVHSQESVDGIIDALNAIYHIQHTFVIHASRIELLNYLNEQFYQSINVHIINTHSTKWGGDGLALATIEMIRTALSFDSQWSRIILIDGSAYPLQKPQFIEKHAKVSIGSSPICIKGIKDDSCARFNHVAFKQPFGKRPPNCPTKTSCTNTPNNRPVFYGMQWFILSRDLAQAVADDIKWRLYLQGMHIPDESLILSIVHDALASRNQVVPDYAFIYVEWDEKRCGKSMGPGHPCEFNESNLQLLGRMATEGRLFARKLIPGTKIRQRIQSEIW